jgi:hypothetical protein
MAKEEPLNEPMIIKVDSLCFEFVECEGVHEDPQFDIAIRINEKSPKALFGDVADFRFSPWEFHASVTETNRDRFFIFTCGCGNAGCNGWFKGILVKHEGEQITWFIDEKVKAPVTLVFIAQDYKALDQDIRKGLRERATRTPGLLYSSGTGASINNLLGVYAETSPNFLQDKPYILEGEILGFEDSRGDYALVKVNGKVVRLFFPLYSSYGWNELDNKGQLDTLKGRKIRFHLVLLNLLGVVKKAKKLERGYSLKENATYSLNGIIVRDSEVQNRFSVMDCSLPVYVDLEGKEATIGSWVTVEGRLDAYLVDLLDERIDENPGSSQGAEPECVDSVSCEVIEQASEEKSVRKKQQREIEPFFLDARFLQYAVIQEDSEEEGAGEREALLKVLPSCAIVECFVGMFHETNFARLVRWDRIRCELELKEDKLEITDQRTKHFKQEDRVFGSNKTHLTGQIVYSKTRKESPDLVDYVIDCGFPVFVLCDKEKTNLKIGDCVAASGRLDVFLHEVYPTRTKNLDESVERIREPGEKALEIRMEIAEIDESFLYGRKNLNQE